jgi:cytochrome P450
VAATEEELPLAFNPFDPDFKKNPYPTYARLRNEDPVHESPLGFLVLTRYDDATTLLRDPRGSSDSTRSEAFNGLVDAGDIDPEVANRRPFLFMDPPDHTRLRGLVSKAFTPRSIEQLRTRAEELTAELIGAMEGKETVDVIADLAYPLPLTIISDMLGVPREDEERFRGWSHALARSLDPDFLLPPDAVAAREQAIDEFADYFHELIDDRRTSPRDDMLTRLVEAEEAGDKLSENELLSTCILLLVAGHETTVNLIANGVLALARHPEQRARLRNDPSLVKTAVEEVLRYDPPVQMTGRLATEPITLPSTTLPKEGFAITLLGAANHDPDQFPDPERFDITRTPNAHIAFSLGHHFCLGASLARMEGQVALNAFVQRFEHFDVATDDLTYKDNLVLRGLTALPITVS